MFFEKAAAEPFCIKMVILHCKLRVSERVVGPRSLEGRVVFAHRGVGVLYIYIQIFLFIMNISMLNISAFNGSFNSWCSLSVLPL